MSVGLSSCVRVFKLISMSTCCSFLLLILQLFFDQNFTFLHIVSLLLFLAWIALDSYQFSSLYTTLKDTLLGLIVPLFASFAIITLAYFVFPEDLFNFLFLPMRAFESLDFLGFHSLILSAICWLVIMLTMSWVGSMHPIDFDDDYFSPQS